MKLKPGRLTIPKELDELRRINQALPFHDPIARTIRWRDQDIVLKTTPWRWDARVQRRLDWIRRKRPGWEWDA